MQKRKIGLVGIWFPEAKEMLHELTPPGFELVEALSPGEFWRLEECEAMVSRLTADPGLIDLTPRMRFWQVWGSGFEYCDIEAWGRRGIPIANCPGVNAGIVAELTIMLMLAGYRNLLQINRDLRNGHFPRSEYFGKSFMLRGKTVGILGLGRIGRRVAGLVSAFGAKVIYYDILRQREQEERFDYRFVSFDELLKTSDVLSIHCPLDDSTRGMIDETAFAKMKPTAMFVNAARGAIVKEAALIDALNSGKIATACLDVYEHEPLPPGHPLLSMDNVVASAHAAGNTRDNTENMARYVMENIDAFFAGRQLNSPEDIVNTAFLKA
ncbi:MAG: 2-hydroxyacid dehydrogenase [Clostridia bacterium]|nr:2-hydroxyacid dehydrogenase [Clostridia bacterium]